MTMRTMKLVAGILVLAGAAMAAPAARAHGGPPHHGGRRVEVVPARGHSRHCAWIPAHREWRTERFLERPGYWTEEFVPAVTRTVLDLSRWRLVTVVTTPATTRRTWVPARWCDRTVPVWVEGRWACSGHVDC